MTVHVSPDELLSLVFDATDLSAAAAHHLETCAHCRQQEAELRLLATDLTIARLSEPGPAALARYQALFAQVQQQPAPLQRLANRLRAVLTWDSRQQPLLQGVRSGGAAVYRQLYAAEDVELELMVEPAGSLRRVEGDLIVEMDAGVDAPALVELLDSHGEPVYSVETDADGIFRIEGVQPGRYQAMITRVHAAPIEVTTLEIV
ncbi:MAG TPA: hypothetical protein DCL15_00770 [Chloroflexi bacterium]|nr:hypothetical protein [Chloroflexota bacterium]HHW85642.1 carboxypeptidase regulatory-like domain-containing protein [Chloroflexota bacterium]